MKILVKISSLFVLCYPALAQAAPSGGGPVELSSLIWPVINFSLYASLLVYGYRRLIRPVLRDRSMQVVAHLGRAREQLDAAENQLETLNDQWAAIEEEKAEIRARLEQEGKNIAKALQLNAKKSAEALQADTKRRVAGELAKAESVVREAVVAEGARIARERLERELNSEDDRRLRQDALRTF